MSRDPLFHFVVLASMLFAANYFWSTNRKEQIVVDEQTAAFLIEQRENLLLRQLGPEETREVIENYIEEEILYREAYKRGLDRVDARARRDMIRRMRDLIGSAENPQPTEAELRAYFDENAARYEQPARVSLEHVYYPDPTEMPEDVLKTLRAGENPEVLGETIDWYGVTTPLFSSRELGGIFGPETAKEILEIGDSQWHGPFEFSRGSVLLRIAQRQPATAASFEDVERYVLEDWIVATDRQAIEDEVERLAEGYEVSVEAGGLNP